MSASINYHRGGEGPPLVLLHGVGLSWQIWAPVIALLEADFDVIACDSPGFGASAPLPRGVAPTIPAYADAFEWFLAELGLERPHVAGNSMGGAIALELARSGAAGSATAFSPAGFWNRAELRYAQLSLLSIARLPGALRPLWAALMRTRAARAALLRQYFGDPLRIPAEELQRTLAGVWSAPAMVPAVEAFSQYSFGAARALRSTTVTIAWGRGDRLLPYRTQSRRARAQLPWATHVTLGAGHVPFHDDPPACAEVIRACVRRAREPARA